MPRVVIVGAGPTGVTAATLLAQYGVQCLVLDRWHEVFPQPRAVHLDDEVYRILGTLGIADAFRRISRPSYGLRLLDRDHRVLAEFSRDGVAPHSGYPRANMFDQPKLEELLRENLLRQSGVTFRGGVEVKEVRAASSGSVEVTFEDLETKSTEVARARFVLGCDGANSTVRTAIGSTMEDLGFEQRWLVVDVETPADLHKWDGVHQVCDARRAATYMRIGATRYRWEFRLVDGETAADYETVDSLFPLLAPWTEDLHSDDLDLVRVGEYTFHAKVADRWRCGNVFLLGDAAHLTPPFIGQGMGAGMRDAANLAWKIHGVLTGALDHSVLESYENERKPHATAIVRLAKLTGTLMTAGGRFGDLLRAICAPRLSLVPGLRARVVSSETSRLHGAPWITAGRRDKLAGRLCPNPVMPDGRRLDEHRARRFALVTPAPLSASDLATLAGRQCLVVDSSTTPDLQSWLISANATAAVVRPDGTVMQSGNNPSMLCAAVAVMVRRGSGLRSASNADLSFSPDD
ncbi:bifunctional 3-(3-hydroxy-phenyl)propionate/3-hydroxycinnamic acid hydroxylase [Nocardioides sp.]|nr:bifunctional 3-(3-hydroxy-phenyl)propionate/3-hydroxycinnamic acid hydroxylase [Nocardioides sp.]